jgi:hypothetical protein
VGMGLPTGSNRYLERINRFGQCFLRGVYMSTMLISEAGQYRMTLYEKIVKGLEHGDNCTYTGKFYS